MFIVSDRANQLCNRLSLFRDLMSASIELNHQLAIPFFDDYASCFIGSSNDLFCRFPSARLCLAPTNAYSRKAFRRQVERVVRQLKHRQGLAKRLGAAMVTSDYASTLSGESSTYDLASPQFAELASRHRFIFLSGPLFRVTSKDWVVKHGDRIRRYFEPVPAIRKVVNRVLEQQRQSRSILVGVHIRRGDYATFLSGRYHYSHAQYAAVMRRVREVLMTQLQNQHVMFLLSSNEDIPEEPYTGMHCIRLRGTDVEDLYTLAGCDYLIGPPSTFGKWAAWHGRVPRYTLSDPEHTPQLSEFKRF
jgi:hypothetical protein